jgi:protein-S-isoprenylcysteine O-methyltransferase Ste14
MLAGTAKTGLLERLDGKTRNSPGERRAVVLMGDEHMRIGASLLLIALGAILKFAVTDSVRHVNLGVVGVVLMVVGIAGLVIEAILAGTRRRTDVVVQQDPYERHEITRAPRY